MGASFPANVFCRNLSKTRCFNKCSFHFSRNPDVWVLWMWLVVRGMWLVLLGMCLVLPGRLVLHEFVMDLSAAPWDVVGRLVDCSENLFLPTILPNFPNVRICACRI